MIKKSYQTTGSTLQKRFKKRGYGDEFGISLAKEDQKKLLFKDDSESDDEEKIQLEEHLKNLSIVMAMIEAKKHG